MRCEARQTRQQPRGKYFTLALAEAARLYGVRNPTEGERQFVSDLLALGVSVRETVDRLFAPNAPAYSEAGGLQQFLADTVRDRYVAAQPATPRGPWRTLAQQVTA